MIRLEFKNSRSETYLCHSEGNLFLLKNKYGYSSSISEAELLKAKTETSFRTELENCNILNEKTDYTEFLKEIFKLNSEKIPGIYFCFWEEPDEIHIFKNLVNHNYSLDYCFSYRCENIGLADFTKKLFRTEDYKWNMPIAFTCTYNNNYSFITNFYILQTLYIAESIKAKKEEVYIVFKKKCKNGKIREIVAPHPEIKVPLRKLNTILQYAYDKRNSNFQVAYKRGKNVKSGAALHQDHNFIFNLDIKDFFPSCKKQYVKKYLNFLFSYSFNRFFIEEKFYDIILKNDALFIGSPISGTIANVILSNALEYMNNICKKYDITLSVYADDITMSSNKFLSKDYVESVFNEAFSKYGLSDDFKLNTKKSKGASNNRRKITGVRINHLNQITVPKHYFKELRTMLHHLSLGDNVDVNKLRGKIAYALMIDESGKVLRYLSKFKKTVKQFNLSNKI